MEETKINYKTAVLAKEKGFLQDSECFYFYSKPNSKMFGIDEHGRYYPIKNKPNSLYVLGNAACLNSKNAFLAPTQSLLQKWIREVHNIHITIFSQSQESWMYRITKKGQKLEDGLYGEDFYTYEEALEESLYQALLLI